MAFMLYSIDDAVDHKYVIMKPMNGQAKTGTLIHVMDTHSNSNGVTVDYRVTKTGQNYVAKFPTVKEFCKWCKPDTFIARHYDSLSKKDIRQYLKITGRTFTTFCLPLIVICLAVLWGVGIGVIGMPAGAIVAGILSVVAVIAILYVFKAQKEKMYV